MLVRGENNHGVAKAFVDFMNQQGMVYEDGRYIRDQVYDPLFVFGLPVTGAYWVKARSAASSARSCFRCSSGAC